MKEMGDEPGIKIGRYKEVEKRFEKEFLSDGSCRLIFWRRRR